ncbi:MAG: LCP family protein [Lachnospiraceae bacterium]|nr:LCP family protein [Lachnospiraceae bacterium]
MGNTRSKAKILRSLKRKKIILTIIECFFALIFIALGVVVLVPSVRTQAMQTLAQSPFGKNIISMFAKEKFDNSSIYDSDFDDAAIEVNDMEYNYSSEYTEFIMFGIDSRDSTFDEGTNSDSMVIVSVHNTTGEVNMVSLYRDTYLRIYNNDGSYRYSKLNSAYSSGGAAGAINTINKNLDMQIKDYVTVNFSGVAEIIDSLGGIEVNLTDDEVSQLNHHLKSTLSSTGEYSPKVTSGGKNVHLNGLQATTYCRIRKATFYDPETGNRVNDDYGRAARQRLVVMKLVDKAKKAGMTELQEMMDTVLNSKTKGQDQIVKTSFSMEEMVDMLPIIFKFSLGQSSGFPRKLTTKSINGADCVLAKGLSRNVKILHKFLYGEEDYVPTPTVDEISNEIKYSTGIDNDGSDDNVDDTILKTTEETESTSVANENVDDMNFDYDDKGKSDFY